MMSAPTHKLSLTLNGATSTVFAHSLEGALAVARAFEAQHSGDREVFTEVRELDGSNAGLGKRVHNWWGGAKVGPVDARHPLEKLFMQSLRSGRSVLIGDLDGKLVRVSKRRASSLAAYPKAVGANK